MRGYKYVSFSKGTAKINTDMIVREYQRIIEEYEQDLIKFNKKKYTIKTKRLPFNGSIVEKLDDERYEVTWKLDYKQLKSIVKEIEEKESESVEKFKELELIKEEYSRFCKRFVKRFNCR